MFCLLLSLCVCVCVVCCLLIGEIKICINYNLASQGHPKAPLAMRHRNEYVCIY